MYTSETGGRTCRQARIGNHGEYLNAIYRGVSCSLSLSITSIRERDSVLFPLRVISSDTGCHVRDANRETEEKFSANACALLGENDSAVRTMKLCVLPTACLPAACCVFRDARLGRTERLEVNGGDLRLAIGEPRHTAVEPSAGGRRRPVC